MIHRVYKIVRILFLVMVQKGLIDKHDMEIIRSLSKEYSDDRIDESISNMESIRRINNIGKENEEKTNSADN